MKFRSVCVALSVLMISAVSSMAEASTNAAAGDKAAPVKIGKLVFEGGDGSSIEQAVVIKNAKDEMEGVDAEDKWVRKIHPGWRKGAQALMSDNGKSYDRIDYTTPKGETKTLFFDITGFFGK